MSEDANARASRAPGMIRTMLVVGPILTCAGIAWKAIAPASEVPNAAVLVGFATCIYGTHRFGRLGVELGARDESPGRG